MATKVRKQRVGAQRHAAPGQRVTARHTNKLRREGKGRERKGRERKGREGQGREGREGKCGEGQRAGLTGVEVERRAAAAFENR
jgi:hypothetical protein